MEGAQVFPAQQFATLSGLFLYLQFWRPSQPRALTPNLWIPDALRLAGPPWRGLSASAAVGQADALFPEDVGFPWAGPTMEKHFGYVRLTSR